MGQTGSDWALTWLLSVCAWVRVCYLPGGLDTFPHAEVADDPGEDETQDQLPPQAAHLLDATRDLQGPPPGGWPRGW